MLKAEKRFFLTMSGGNDRNVQFYPMWDQQLPGKTVEGDYVLVGCGALTEGETFGESGPAIKDA